MKCAALVCCGLIASISPAFSQPSWQNTAFHAPPAAVGCGMGVHMQFADSNGDGVLDIVASAPFIGFQGGGVVLVLAP